MHHIENTSMSNLINKKQQISLNLSGLANQTGLKLCIYSSSSSWV